MSVVYYLRFSTLDGVICYFVQDMKIVISTRSVLNRSNVQLELSVSISDISICRYVSQCEWHTCHTSLGSTSGTGSGTSSPPLCGSCCSRDRNIMFHNRFHLEQVKFILVETSLISLKRTMIMFDETRSNFCTLYYFIRCFERYLGMRLKEDDKGRGRPKKAWMDCE